MRERVMTALRRFSVDYAEFGRRFAAWLSLHSTDAEALLDIADAEHRGAPLTPSLLAQRIPLSSGATATLINRLEEAGLVQRTRVHTDRRVVTLTATPQVDELADEFFSGVTEEISVFMAKYPEEFLISVEDFLDRLHATMAGVLESDSRKPSQRER